MCSQEKKNTPQSASSDQPSTSSSSVLGCDGSNLGMTRVVCPEVSEKLLLPAPFVCTVLAARRFKSHFFGGGGAGASRRRADAHKTASRSLCFPRGRGQQQQQSTPTTRARLQDATPTTTKTTTQLGQGRFGRARARLVGMLSLFSFNSHRTFGTPAFAIPASFVPGGGANGCACAGSLRRFRWSTSPLSAAGLFKRPKCKALTFSLSLSLSLLPLLHSTAQPQPQIAVPETTI